MVKKKKKKKPTCQLRRLKRCGFNPWVGKIPGGEQDNPLQYSCLENLWTEVWWSVVHRDAKSQTGLNIQARPWLCKYKALYLWIRLWQSLVCYRLLDSITYSVDVNLSKPWEVVKDRGACLCAVVHGFAKGRTQLSDWTTSLEFESDFPGKCPAGFPINCRYSAPREEEILTVPLLWKMILTQKVQLLRLSPEELLLWKTGTKWSQQST